MIKILWVVLLWLGEKLLSFAFKRILYGAGLGLVAYGVSQGLFNMLLSYVQSNFALFSPLFYLISISGLDVFISMILSAISTRMMFDTGRFTLRKM
ncbi:DUF2523 family protein [Acinetobacter puyangensis]|uniref:DUF2523 family protein n=1 Tax=Acinetobacter puyangensis TaxID=1096779 RepID=UPI003A4D7FD6